MKTKRLTLYALLLALAMILSYLESLIPLSFAVPGIKLGLANIVTLIALIPFWIRMRRQLGIGQNKGVLRHA